MISSSDSTGMGQFGVFGLCGPKLLLTLLWYPTLLPMDIKKYCNHFHKTPFCFEYI